MEATHCLTMGADERLDFPAEVLANLNWQRGTKLILTATETGVTLMSLDQAHALLKAQIGDRSLAEELIAERHAEAAADAAF